MVVTSPPTSTSVNDTDFDYVIVGSGAGGAPLAARLSAHGDRVPGAGGGPGRPDEPTAPAREVSDVPALHGPSTEHPDLSWQFFVDHYTTPEEPDPKWDAKGNGICYPCATGIGACTIHNAMITIAGPASDWDELAWFLNDP